jgi:hypothetical protein
MLTWTRSPSRSAKKEPDRPGDIGTDLACGRTLIQRCLQDTAKVSASRDLSPFQPTAMLVSSHAAARVWERLERVVARSTWRA